jgi:CBS domain containing-hemolysin-like protein
MNSLSVSEVLVRFLSVLLLIAINAFFVTAEFAMVSVRRSRISQLVEAGDLQAQTVQSLQRSLDRLLSTTQLGITLSSLALGWIGEGTMAVLVNHLLRKLPLTPELTDALSHSFALPVAFFLIAYLQIVLGELCPKSVALIYSEKLARFLGPPIGVIARIFNPFIWILNQSTRYLLCSIGIKYTGEGRYNQVTSEELQLIIATEGESTGLEAKERALLKNVFEFGEVMAVEVMVPRTQLVAISEEATFGDLLEEVAVTGHSRYPVKGESLDDILGIIDFKELAPPLAKGELTAESSFRRWLKPVKFVSESMPLDELLSLMQRSQLKMVIVVDEFGGTSGLITLQDLIAEIIDSDLDDGSTEDISLQMLDEQTFLVEAQINLEELNKVLDLDLPLTDEYQTLGGFLLYQWQKIPTVGEILSYHNLEFTVVTAEPPRLLQIRLHRREEESINQAVEDEVIAPSEE